MKFFYALGLIGLASALPGPAVGMPPAPRALHKVYDLHPREHQVEEPQLERRADPAVGGTQGLIQAVGKAINILGISIRANAGIISSTAVTMTNTTAGPGVNQVLLTAEHLIEGAINGMTTSVQHSTAQLRRSIDNTEAGLLGIGRGLTQQDINALATSLQELTSLFGTIRDISTIDLQALSPPVKQIIRPDLNALESSLGPLLQPIRTLVFAVINLNKNNPDVDTTLLNGIPEGLDSIVVALITNIL